MLPVWSTTRSAWNIWRKINSPWTSCRVTTSSSEKLFVEEVMRDCRVNEMDVFFKIMEINALD
jgi:hypothetical protein